MAAMVVNAGKAILANRTKGSGSEPNYVAWGTSNTAEAVAQTALVAAAAEARVAGTSSIVTSSSPGIANDTYQVVGQITCAGAGKTIQEVGLFDALNAGNMLCRAVHGAQTLNVGDAIEYTIQVTMTG